MMTIGVYGFDGGSFLQRLRRADVCLLLDVRQRRGVRGPQYAWANSRRLQAALADTGIAYAHHPELAPTTELRELQYAEDDRLGVGKRSRRELAAAYTSRYTKEIPERPEVSELARYQARRGAAVTNERHESRVLAAPERVLLDSVDGTRTIADLAEVLLGHLRDGDLTLERDGKEVEVTLKVGQRYGVYAQSFPADCDKTETIEEELLTWLLEQQRYSGKIDNGRSDFIYAHTMVTLALCEGWGLSKDPRLLEPCKMALRYLAGQRSPKGAWGYGRAQPDTCDSSATTWALKCYRAALDFGLPVERGHLNEAYEFLKSISINRAGITGYNPNQPGLGLDLTDLALNP